MRRTAAFLFPGLAIALAIATWIWSGRSQVQQPKRDFGADAVEKWPTQSVAKPEDLPRSSPSELSLPVVMLDPISWVDRVPSMGRLYRLLLPEARSGNPKAIAAVFELMDRCAGFYPEEERRHPKHELERRDVLPGSQDWQQRSAALELHMSYCDYPFAPGEARSLRKELANALTDAASRGDPTAQAAQFRFGDGSEEAALSAYEKADSPFVRSRALLAFVSLNGPAAQAISESVFNRQMLDPAVVRRIEAQAARWESCAQGSPCGPNQRHELNECLYQGNCGLGLGVQAFIQQRELSAREFALMQQYLTELRAALSRG